LNILGVLIFAALMYMTARRGVTDPVCGMKVDRDKAVTKTIGGETYCFCSTHCLHAFEADPDKYSRGSAPGVRRSAAHAHH
jgi:YHS domain-containing protein